MEFFKEIVFVKEIEESVIIYSESKKIIEDIELGLKLLKQITALFDDEGLM